MAFEYLRKLVSDIASSMDPSAKKDAISKASSYVNSLGADVTSAASVEGIDIFSSGENFKNYLTSKTGVDESIFSKSISQLEQLDLSGDKVEKESENSNDKNSDVYNVLNEIYSNDILKGAIDADGDGKISNKEAQAFISDIKGLDSNANDLSFDDFSKLVDSINFTDSKDDPLSQLTKNFQQSFEKLTDKLIENIDNVKNQGAIDLPTGGGIASNPYVPGSVGTVNNSSNAANGAAQGEAAAQTQSPEDKKAQLETKIEECNKEISEINALTQEDVKKAVEDCDKAKEVMEKQLKEDDKVSKELKEKFNDTNDKIQKKDEEISNNDTEISNTESSLITAQNSVSSLKSALSSLACPTGKEEDKESDAKINERKSRLESQIKEKEDEVKSLQDKLDELKDKKETLTKEKEELTKQKEELQKEIEKTASPETKEAIKNYNEKEKAIEEVKASKLAEVQGELKSAQDELKKVEEEIQTSENKKAENKFDADFDKMLGHVLGSEGGFSNHPNDNGGATNYGITEATYRAYKGDSSADVRNITKEEVQDIYYKNYYQASGAEQYAKNGDSAYAFAVFDAAVNHGVGAAQKMDSQAGGDVDKFMEVRKQKYINIVANNSSQQVFAKGWQNRWNSVYSFIDPSHQYESYV